MRQREKLTQEDEEGRRKNKENEAKIEKTKGIYREPQTKKEAAEVTNISCLL